MTEVEKEKALDLYPLPVTIEGTNIILEQMKKCICRIENKNGSGTGFLCYIPYKNKILEVMMTNNHIINEDIIKNNKSIEILLNDNKEKKIINIEKRKIYTSIKYDTTIIPINSEEDKINNFLEIDEEIFNSNNNIYNKSIYILQYPRINLGEQKASVSYGILKNIQDEYNIIHYCYTEHGSSGSPILNLLNKKIIGIHKENVKKYNYNRGTYLKYPIIEYINNIYLNKKRNNNKIDKYLLILQKS
jgi:V8-like Glu-specific endopeptidase